MRSDQDLADDCEGTDQVRQGRSQAQRAAAQSQQKRINYTRRGVAPAAYNGIHRRRKKRIMW